MSRGLPPFSGMLWTLSLLMPPQPFFQEQLSIVIWKSSLPHSHPQGLGKLRASPSAPWPQCPLWVDMRLGQAKGTSEWV